MNDWQRFYYDRPIFVLALSLIMFGLLMVASASMVVSDRLYGHAWHFVFRQIAYISSGLLLAWIATRIPMDWWENAAIAFLLLSILLLVLVLVPGIGKVVNGSRRWLNLGVVALQVSEVVKVAIILYLASYLQRHLQQVQTRLIGFVKPMVILSLLAMLLLLEPDFGATTVIGMTVLAMLFIAGVRLWPFLLVLGLAALLMAALAVFSPYRMARLTTFLNPWGHAFDSGYQLTQALIAFGRGGVLGVGLGNSIQKLFYLPEAHTDFIFAVIAEELGLVGELLLLLGYGLLVARLFQLGQQARQVGHDYSAFVAYGVAFWLGFQTMINMGVNAGMLPTKGLTLPFISYGGSSMLVTCAVIGVMLRIADEVRLANPPSRLHRAYR